MKKIKVSTPGKLMLFGEHSVIYNRPCIVAAVDQRFEVIAEKIKEKEMIVQAPGIGIYDYRKRLNELGEIRITKELRFVEVVVREFYKRYKNGGIKIETKNHFSSEHGFGSSAAVTVGLAKALFELENVKISNKELFDFCYQVVLDVQGVGSGFDIAAALYGGVLYFVTGGREIKKIRFRTLTSENSEPSLLPIVVGYTGIKADTPTLVRQVKELKKHDQERINNIFDEISGITERAKILLEKNDLGELGILMTKNQELLDQLGVNSEELDNLIIASQKAGALGSKLSGAGGGDCMIALVDGDTRQGVEQAIKKAGGEVLDVELGAEGVKIEL